MERVLRIARHTDRAQERHSSTATCSAQHCTWHGTSRSAVRETHINIDVPHAQLGIGEAGEGPAAELVRELRAVSYTHLRAHETEADL
eukprot:1421165-Rhodomonas_salina.1